jgi:hypothetical protein
VVLVGCGGPSVDIWTATAQGNIEAVKQHLAAGTDVIVVRKLFFSLIQPNLCFSMD